MMDKRENNLSNFRDLEYPAFGKRRSLGNGRYRSSAGSAVSPLE